MLSTNFKQFQSSPSQSVIEKFGISSSCLETELAPTEEMICGFAEKGNVFFIEKLFDPTQEIADGPVEKKINRFIDRLYDLTSCGHVRKVVLNLFNAIEIANKDVFNKHLEVLSRLHSENYLKILLQSYQLSRVALIMSGTGKEDLDNISNHLLSVIVDKINGPGNISLDSLKNSPKLDVSSSDVPYLQKFLIEQLPQRSIMEQNLAQVSLKERAIKPLSITKDKPEENSSETILTKKIVWLCSAVWFSTLLSDVPVEMGVMCMNKVLKGEIWRIGTAPILHENAWHLLSNMWALEKYGPIVEKRFGVQGFAKITACALAANTIAKMVFSDYWQRSLGFSGVLFALTGAVHFAKPKAGMKIDQSIQSIMKFWGLQLTFALVMSECDPEFSIGHVAHVSGYLAGAAYSYLSE